MPSEIVDSIVSPSNPQISIANVVAELDKTVFQPDRQKLDIWFITNPQQLTVAARRLEFQLDFVVKSVDSAVATRTSYYTVSQKTRHQTLAHNFTKYQPILKLFSLTDSVINLQQNYVEIFHHALNTSLHYLVKYESQKNGVNLKYVL